MIRLRKWFGSRLVEIDTVQLRKQASTGLENELERLVDIDTVRFRKWMSSSLSLSFLSLISGIRRYKLQFGLENG